MIKVRTPTRIDLAGGTLDLKPLFQFVYPDVYSTINIAINLYNEVEIVKLPTEKIIIVSNDLEISTEFSSLNDLKENIKNTHNPLLMIMRAIYYFKANGLQIVLTSSAPKGSGLGNSSSLLIAVVGALNQFTGANYSNDILIDIAQGIETSVLQIPTGSQDYIAAMYGGLNKITYNLTNHEVKMLNLNFIAENILQKGLLCYVEEPKRFESAVENPNWDIFKRFVEEPLELFEQLGDINNVVETMSQAIEQEDWNLFIHSIKNETAIRSKLSKSIISENMSKIINSLQDHKVQGYKICGAGGGGSILIFTEEKDQLKELLKTSNCKLIDFSIDNVGFHIIN